MNPFGAISVVKISSFFDDLATRDLAKSLGFCLESALASLRATVE